MRITYKKLGHGSKAIVFIHGVWMSQRFFHKQMGLTIPGYSLYFLDLPSHGDNIGAPNKNTVSAYAQDLEDFFLKENINQAVPVGWSMGALVVWEYVKQFGANRFLGNINISQPPTDFKYEGYDHAFFDFSTLKNVMHSVQCNREAFLIEFLPSMFQHRPSPADLAWMHHECSKVNPAVATAILFDQATSDQRKTLPLMLKPNLLCWGRGEGLIPLQAGYDLAKDQPNTKIAIFEESSHCPFWEEPDSFNQALTTFVTDLGKARKHQL